MNTSKTRNEIFDRVLKIKYWAECFFFEDLRKEALDLQNRISDDEAYPNTRTLRKEAEQLEAKYQAIKSTFEKQRKAQGVKS